MSDAAITGRARVFGEDIDTDQIIPARYLVTSDPQALAAHAMEDAYPPGFQERAQPGDIIVAGRNFGSGSSREHAPIALKAFGISAVVAPNFARIFFRNAVNVGMTVVVCEGVHEITEEGDELRIEPEQGIVTNVTKGQSFQAEPLPDVMRTIIAAGGLVPYTRERLGITG